MEAITSTTKAVIPAAGLGTRLLPTTKEIPKEMLPIPVRKGRLTVLEPMLQVIFEQLYSVGTREFCFIVGRGKREIEDHFSADWAYSDKLKDPAQRLELEAFYGKLETSRIYFANQGNQKGFGGAVLSAEEFARGEPFMVHAGDDIVVSENVGHVNDLRMTFKDRKADAVLLVQEVKTRAITESSSASSPRSG